MAAGTRVGPEIDREIRRTYLGPPRRGRVRDLARRLGWPRWRVTRRAVQLGLVTPRAREPVWSEPELLLLEKWGHLSPEGIRRKLKAAGYRRSATAIVVKRKRMHLTASNLGHGYRAAQLAQAFGVGEHTVLRWIDQGWLKAQRSKSARTAGQGGNPWWIRGRDVRRFVLDSVGVVNLARVDKHWFVDLIAGK